MDECNCLTHTCPHWQHLDALHKQKNHELLMQACRYVETGKACQDAAEDALLRGAFDAIMGQYAMEELARLNEKARHLTLPRLKAGEFFFLSSDLPAILANSE